MTMLRSSSMLWSRNLSVNSRIKSVNRHQFRFSSSSSSGGGRRGGGGGKFMGLLTATTGIGIGGVIGYAALDKEFRDNVEQTLPGSSEIFSMILGNSEATPPKPLTTPPSKLRPIVATPPPTTPFPVTTTTPSKKLTESKSSDSLPPPPPPPPPPPLPPIEKMEEKPEEVIVKESKPPQIVKEEVLKKEKNVEDKSEAPESPKSTPKAMEESSSKKKDDLKIVENLNYENNFSDMISQMKSLTEKAAEKGEETIESVKNHMNLLQGVLENSSMAERDESAWDKVFEAANAKSESIAKCNSVIEEAKSAIQTVVDEIEIGHKNKVPGNILLEAENKVKLFLSNLEKIHSKLVHVQQESKVVDEFRDLVEEGKQKFRQEMASLLPSKSDVLENGVTSQLTEEDLNLFIQHAYRKVLFLQQELAKQKTLEQLKFKRSLESQKVASNIETSDSIMVALDRQKKDLDAEFARKLASVREEMEFETRNQLKRQMAAHVDHLKDIKEIQESEFERKLQRKMHEFMENEINSAQSDIAKIKGSYEGIVAALEERGNADKEASEAQKLWLNATALHEISHQSSSADGTINITPVVETLRKSNDSFVSTISSGISNNVTTDENLKERFLKVERLARQTALLKDDNVSYSPMTLFLSYLQSKFIWSPSSTEDLPKKNSDMIDVENLSTFDIVWLAKGSLDRGDIEQTVKYMTLLRGEPGRVAKDWINDARQTLEIRQASEALIAYASSINVKCLPN